MTLLRVWLDRLEEGLMAFLLTVMTLITFTQVVARYVFNYSFVWALELNTFLFAWLIFLGASYGVRVGSHIGVEMLVKALSPAKARALGMLAAVLCMAYAAIVFVGGWTYVAKMYEIGIMAQDLPIPQWVPRLVLPIGFGLLFLRFGQVLWRLATGREAHLLGDEVKEALQHAVTDADEGRR
ncbi:MAG: TRAP transporter small permease [Burkholderiales bacterium]|nr:TRAP transporter small permease [Burkholderiales bacterium]